jgi:hypothetical protein
VLLTIWALSPAILWIDPTAFGVFHAHTSTAELIDQIGQIWLVVGFGGLIFRTVHLFFLRDVQTGLVWITKIATDPFHDVMLYWKAPLFLLKGELIDPMGHASHGHEESLATRDA